jgi:hypothetical protein
MKNKENAEQESRQEVDDGDDVWVGPQGSYYTDATWGMNEDEEEGL